MYFKVSFRQHPEQRCLIGYYRIVESYRNSEDRVCHRTILNVGYLDYLSDDQLNKIQKQLTDRASGKQGIFFEEDEEVNRHVDRFWDRMIKEKRIDSPQSRQEKKGKYINTETIKHEDVKEIGSEWIGYQAIKQLEIAEYLRLNQWEEEQIQLTLTQIISRAVYPASEFKTSRWIKENSGICEITKYPVDKITKDKLYQNALALYGIKDGLEQHLARRTNELFDIQDKIILYDLTNTYFEGQKRNSKLAQYGRSKEKRTDAKIIVLALVINEEGFIKYSTVYEGNTADCNTLPDMVDRLKYGSSDSDHKSLVVMDAGIATEDNLKLLEQKGYHYLCVNRSKLQDYSAVENTTEQIVFTQDKQQLRLQKVKSLQHTDYFLKVKSPGKTIKEQSMKTKFESRFEEELEKIKNSISKRHGIKKADKVNQRIGRAIQKYPSVAKNYDITIKTDDHQQVIQLDYLLNEFKNTKDVDSLGVYFLRTNLSMQDEKVIWKVYNTIREIEYSFRTLKTDLDLRPIYHKNDDATLAHLHLGLMAYWIVNTIRYQLKAKEIHANWKEIIRIGNTQKVITTTGKDPDQNAIEIRKCSEPSAKLREIYQALQFKPIPFSQRKFVVHNPEINFFNPLIVNTS